MEIYRNLSDPASKEFEKLLNSKLSKTKVEEGKIIMLNPVQAEIAAPPLGNFRVYVSNVSASASEHRKMAACAP